MAVPAPASIEQDRPRPTFSSSAVVTLANVRKSYGGVDALANLTMEVHPGEIFGLIGPSGCGKTTLARLLVGRIAASAGQVRVWGRDPQAFRPRDRQEIGYTPQGFALYPTLSVEQNARFMASLYGLGWLKRRRRVRETLQFLEIWDARRRLARDVSGGMQRRLALACALVHSPRLLIVDEPTAGLDPILRAKVWGHLNALRDGGTTIIVTTQYVDEATYCGRVALLREGKLIALGTPDELRARAIGGEELVVEAPGLSRADIVALWDLDCVKRAQWDGGSQVRLLVESAGAATPLVAAALNARGTEVSSVLPHIATFDDIFVALLEQG